MLAIAKVCSGTSIGLRGNMKRGGYTKLQMRNEWAPRAYGLDTRDHDTAIGLENTLSQPE
jgi:hypothetical protein